ncbi:FAD/NAD(P)-binding protein [Brachybacterium sp.]|uniref:FAD/NAD(P)-binding protein n=1 Tax=Brachybacterium sp. TaxID=1891286 RepID=UPI002ED4DC26
MAERAPGTAGDPLRLLVVGAGAKALYALEELAAQGRDGGDLPESAGPLVEITVVDPGEHLGTGAAYHPSQPHHLRLNVGSGILDAPATGAAPSFPDWARTTHPELAEEPYPPRAVVGEYLRLRWRRMQASLAPWATLRHHRGRALAVHRDGERWRLEVTASRQAPGTQGQLERGQGQAEQGQGQVPASQVPTQLLGPAEEILLATGHATGHDSALAPTWTAALPLRPAVLPVQEMLSAEHVPPGCRVAMRGGALTFVDGALTLTLGRGAAFRPDPSGTTGLIHHRSPEEPAVILPTTRHGLLLDAKPLPGTQLPATAERALARGARRLESAGPLTPQQVLDLAVDVAAEMLTGPDAPFEEHRRAVMRTLSTGAEPDLPQGPGRAERALRRSIAVAEGSRAGGPAWALGRTWVQLYPQFTAALRGSEADGTAWTRFLASEQVLERFAFGPPLDVARMLIAMIDSGALDLSWVDAGTSLRADGVHGIPAGAGAPDVVVDAVVAPPGLRGIVDPLARQLLSSGLVTLRPGRRGAVIEADGTALTSAGDRAEGLALLGRATEDHVIGHDTLNRHLHAETGHWAARLSRRAARSGALEETA